MFLAELEVEFFQDDLHLPACQNDERGVKLFLFLGFRSSVVLARARHDMTICLFALAKHSRRGHAYCGLT